MSGQKRDFQKRAVDYALRRWAWDDTEHIMACIDEDWPDGIECTPQEYVDFLAEEYKREDPKEYEWSRV